MLKKQVIVGTIQSARYKKEGKAFYDYGGLRYVIENVNGTPKVTSVLVPQEDLDSIEVIVRK